MGILKNAISDKKVRFFRKFRFIIELAPKDGPGAGPPGPVQRDRDAGSAPLSAVNP